MGVSRNHGSELLVGWQWLSRLRRRTLVTAFVSSVFDDERFLSNEDRRDIRFIDTGCLSEDEINSRHVLHTYRYWRLVVKALKDELQPGDRVVIVSPAAIWFLPFIWGLPIPREHVFYGPIGAVKILPTGGGRRSPSEVGRLAATYAACLAWRACWRWLPQQVSLRYPADWFVNFIGRHYRWCATVPEVCAPSDILVSPKAVVCLDNDASIGGEIVVLFDSRARKNFHQSLMYAVHLATMTDRPVVVVGASDETRQALELRLVNLNVKLQFRARLSRSEFVERLTMVRPTIVSLSLSEGVPSTLLEALVIGCEIRVFDVGGVAWLIRFASRVEESVYDGKVVVACAWDSSSAARYKAYVEGQLTALTEKVVGGG